MELKLIEFAETRQKDIKRFASWVYDTRISGMLRNCHGMLEKQNSKGFVLGICDDELIIYETRIFSKPENIYSIKLSDIIWDDFTYSEELGFINLKYFNNGNMESFTLEKLGSDYGNINQFINKVNELFPGAVKNELSNENIRYIAILGGTGTKVKFDHANEIFELYEKDIVISTYKLIASIKYSDILNCELIEGSVSVIRGGLAAAAVGGTLFGGVGAIVGSNVGSKTSKEIMGSVSIKVTVNNINNPVISFPVFSPGLMKVYKQGAEYENWLARVNEVLGIFSIMLINNSKNKDANLAPQINSGADDIRKYKELLDDGIITKEEFEEVKKRILAL